MSAMTDSFETDQVTHWFRTSSVAKPTAITVALYTAAPGETGGGTKVTGGSYADVNLNPLDANWSASSNGTTDNVAQLNFATPSANWGTVVATGIFFDAVLKLYGNLVASKTVNNGDPAPYYAAGALDVTFA